MKPEESLIKVSPGLLAALSTGGLSLDVFAREIVALECIVAGTSFRQLDKVEPELSKAVKLELKREPNNKHDQWAIALWFEKTHIGYIPRGKNEVIARLMDAGKHFFASLEAKEWEGNWLKLEIKVMLKG